jgi:hypothetical protein
MGMQHARDCFTVVKEMGDLQEWSYGYDIEQSSRGTENGQDVQYLDKLKVHEVSPVLLGAGIGTETVMAKGKDGNDAKLTPEMAEKAGKLVMKAWALRIEAENHDQYVHALDLVTAPQRKAREQLERNLG